ncbi:uncharacterized protein Z520_06936 [Fonsecaea multimorphosa CBS 102226]|uniref:Uncharacterized protein n=1 Tax=Fonsecaea multimorphosa CBS 102226 TaxID=1442371 RepID=A0A0D2K313_9EURO|nr:uncharacterized protein Z520_06936 [Fonsecaea multimorphosa CBS 102226]KIX97484.1 hypothetical protein Z520_06936 [Fonsecaea multimorphosa CBS 102226]OAL23446.1 hypothetical protein AYO22_06496 [Fonsecaea multimorphosa]
MAAFRQPQTAAALTPAEMELRLMWQDAEADFRQMTRRSLKTDQEKRLEDVLADLDRKYRPPESEAGKDSAKAKAKIRATIGKVLQCVQLLGGLAAQGASIVFGPATLCFNAISFLIDVPGKIAEVYEGVGNLFEEISHSLVLFKIYENYTKLDPDLRDGTHKLMISIVRICGLSIKIIEGGVLHQIKIGAKITFLNDDSGVKSELAKFKALIEKQSRVTEAITLQHVLSSEEKIVQVLNAQYENAEKLGKLESGMDIMVADVSDRKMHMILSERLEAMSRMLSTTTQSAQEARKAMLFMRDNLLTGSAQWVLEHEDYTDWKTAEADAIPLLLLSGEKNTGKSFLLAAIEEDLRKTNTDVSIAYYEFTKREAKSTREKHKEDAVTAMKSMSLQLAGQYKQYATEMAGLKDDFKPPESKEKDMWEKLWWDKLQFSKYPQTKEKADFVLMFDGLEDLSESNCAKLIKMLKAVRDESRASGKVIRQHIRIIATASPKVFKDSPITPIEIADHNLSDIKMYIEDELRKDEILQGQHVEMLDLLKAIRTTLPQVAMGSYSVVQQKLERIREAVDSDAYLDDVQTILSENPADDLGKLARKVVNDLNATLKPHDIDQLNELLHWGIFGYEYFAVDQLRATVFLNSGKASLQPFERKLKEKYARILHVNDDRVEVDTDIENLFRSRDSSVTPAATVADLDTARISMTISINQADLRTVQQFFWDLTDGLRTGRFEFSADSSNIGGKGVIQTDEVRASYYLSDQLLKLLNDEPHEKTQCLVPYALTYLTYHLLKVKESLEEGWLGTSERRIIAKRLVDLLSDVDGIEKFWDARNELSPNWIDRDQVETVRSLLKDEKTIDVLQPKERRWVKFYTADSEGKAGIYKPITLMVARHWLRDRSWEVYAAYNWIRKYVDLQNSKDDDEANKKDAEDGDDDRHENNGEATTDGLEELVSSEQQPEPEPAFHVKGIASAAAWVQQVLSLKDEKLDALWYDRLGETCYAANEFQAAKEFYEKAKALPDCQWTVNQGWALAVDKLSESQDNDKAKKKELKESACNEMEIALTYLRSTLKTAEFGDDSKNALILSLKSQASWQAELNSMDQAFALYKEALEVDPKEHAIRCNLLEALYAQGKEADAREMLLRMMNQRGSPSESDLFSDLLLYLTESEVYTIALQPIDLILALARTDERLNVQTLEALQAAIRDARKSNLTISEGMLLLYQGIVLAHGTTDDARIQHAIRCWEDCQSLYLSSRWDLAQTQASAARFVAQHYFQRAVKPGIAAEEREEYLGKLLRLKRLSTSWIHGFRPNSYLASYYVRQNQLEEARQVFMEDMMAAMEILSDSDPENDSYGYRALANILMNTGDDLNALSAWSLLGPDDLFKTSSSDGEHANDGDQNGTPKENGVSEAKPDEPTINGVPEEGETPKPPTTEKAEDDDTATTEIREGPLRNTCDGLCDHTWNYADDLHACRYCPDTQFTTDCLEKLKANKLEHYICHPDHSWLHVPPWNDEEALQVGPGKVRVRGELVDGVRVGGEVVDIQQWLDEIREIWKLPKKEDVPIIAEPALMPNGSSK